MTKLYFIGSIDGSRSETWNWARLLGVALFLTTLGAASGVRAQTAPKLASVIPANGTTAVALSSTLVFVFDQAMNTDVPIVASFPPFLVGNIETTAAGSVPPVTGTWDADQRTLTCQFLSDLPQNTTITWTLNPAGSAFPIESANGDTLATVSGTFTTGSGSGGTNCNPDGVPDSWGSYTLAKNSRYEQTSPDDPTPAAEAPFTFGAFIRSPQAGPTVTAGSVTLPNGSQKTLQALPIGGFLSFSDMPASQAALDTAYPAGNYTYRFTQTGQPERVIGMSLPAVNIPVPKIANFTEAQAINAAQDFTLRWNAFAGAGSGDYIQLTVSDSLGKVVFQAPDRCVPRELAVTATSIVIPANTLKTNQSYNTMLTFGRIFYSSTNAVPQMSGFGTVSKSIDFLLKTGTGGGPGPAAPARFTSFRLLPNGNPQLNLTGTASRAYTIQRTGSLGILTWTTAGTATMDAAGNAVFEDIQVSKTFPAFYRAVSN